jgi:hypothetical protein
MPQALYRLDAIRSDGLTFMDCVAQAIDTPELIKAFDRLYGGNLMRKGTPFELAIDEACGRTRHDCRVFLNFVWEFVFTRVPKIELPPEKAAELEAFLAESKLPVLRFKD